jgi:cyanophycinase
MKQLFAAIFRLCLISLLWWPHAGRASEAAVADSSPTKGSLVIIGGALRPDNAPVWEKIVDLAGGKGAKIAVFASASANPERSGQTLVETLNRYGAQAFMVPVSVKLKQPDYREAARDPALVARVAAANGVYFAGGDQGRITQALLAPDGSQTPILQAVWQVYKNGGVIAGSSAGAAIMSTTMFYDAMPVLPTLKLGVRDGKEIAPGLGFIGDQVFIDQHLIIRGRFARMLPVMQKKNYKLGLGIDENTAMVIRKGVEVEIVGYKGALLLDLTQATSDAKLSAFNLSNARISYLDRGDKFHLQTKVLTPAPDKKALDTAKPYNNAPRFSSDILGNTAVVDLMQDLIDSSQKEMIGLAFGAPDSEKPQLGFEFTFRKVAESVGYFSSANGGEAYTVMNVRMDVRPVQMQLPLYK